MAFGSVHPLAYRPMEAVRFGLLIVWLAKGEMLSRSPTLSRGTRLVAGGKIAVAIALFSGFAMIQMVPLPPSVIRDVSPAAYHLYAKTLEGWPASAPYEQIETVPDGQTARDSEQALIILPSREQVQQGALVPFAPGTIAASSRPDSKAIEPTPAVSRLAAYIYGGRWRPISLAPLVTWSSLLALLSCACAFMFVAYYPFAERPGSRSESQFLRKIMLGIIAAGLLVALVGIIERATWNGKILWFFVPYDWGQAMFEPLPRARGPFVDPDHFGSYLAMIFPLTLSCALFPNLLTPRRAPLAFRIACGSAAFVILVAVLLSLSRGGWLGLAVGSAIMLLLATPRGNRGTRESELGENDPENAPEVQPSASVRSNRLRLALAVGATVLAVALLFVGPDARLDTAARVQQSVPVDDSTILSRFSAWEGGFALIRDFPIVGAGFGAWPEIFPRYQLPPWSELYFNQAHNDFIQLLAETGIVGIALFAWFVFLLIDRLRRGARWLTPTAAPAFAGVIGGLGAMCVIELFDFDLRIPATAFLFAVMLGLAIRIAKTPAADTEKIEQERVPGVIAFGVSLAVVIFAIAAMSQGSIVYPYNLTPPQNLSQARALLTTYPANSVSHLSLLTLLGDETAEPLREAELKRAVWLDPLDPVTRDRYARALLAAGKQADGLEQVRTSVENSPAAATHRYLDPRVLVWLPPAAKKAIEAGLVESVSRGYANAADTLGQFYIVFGRYLDAAKLYAEVAAREPDPDKRADYLRESGDAYTHDDFAQAMAKFREAEDFAPDDSLIYCDMVTMVIGPHRDFELADKTIAQGIENGADPFQLSVALADASEAAFDRPRAEAALEQALKYQPSSFQTLMRLADLYVLDGRSERAVATINRAIELQPDSAALYSRLGQLEENRYHYYAAEQAYRRAAELAPDNLQYRDTLADFEHKLNAAAATAPKSEAH